MKTATLLLNYGCPDSDEAVYPFLYNLFNDPAILPFPFFLRPLIAKQIATARASESTGYYRRIGGSPMLKIIRKQCAALEKILQDSSETRVYIGMRYWHPFIHEAMAKISAWGPDLLVALPLFPHYCSATTGTVFKEVQRNAGALRDKTAYIPAYFDDTDYLEAMVETVRDTLTRTAAATDTVLLFSAHGVPQRLVDRGDPYVGHVKESVAAISQRFPHASVLSFQSRVGRANWYGKSTLEEVVRLGRDGVRSLAVVPISFTSENVETLYELDILVKEAAIGSGIERYIRVPALNTSCRYVKALGKLVQTTRDRPHIYAGRSLGGHDFSGHRVWHRTRLKTM